MEPLGRPESCMMHSLTITPENPDFSGMTSEGEEKSFEVGVQKRAPESDRLWRRRSKPSSLLE